MISERQLDLLELAQDLILQSMESGIVILDDAQVVVTENAAVSRIWGFSGSLLGQRFEECALAGLSDRMRQNLEDSLETNTPAIQFKHEKSPGCVIQVTIRPLSSGPDNARAGTLIYMAEASSRERLDSANEALRVTTDALEAANEELGAANEQLQLTNEELEITNEELQTTNEELQSLNEELETTNDELTERATGVEEANLRYREMLEQVPWPVLLVGADLGIPLWSIAAQRLFGFRSRTGKDLRLSEIPFSRELRQTIARRSDAATKTNRPSIIRNQFLGSNGTSGLYDIHLKPLSSGGKPGVLLLFQKIEGSSSNGKTPTTLTVAAANKAKRSRAAEASR